MNIMIAADLDAIAMDDFNRLKNEAEEKGAVINCKLYSYLPKRDKAFTSFIESQKIDAAGRKKGKSSDFKIAADLTKSLERGGIDCYFLALKEDILSFAVRLVNEYGKECVAYTHADIIGISEKIVPSYASEKKEKESADKEIKQNLEQYADLFEDSGVSELLERFKKTAI